VPLSPTSEVDGLTDDDGRSMEKLRLRWPDDVSGAAMRCGVGGAKIQLPDAISE